MNGLGGAPRAADLSRKSVAINDIVVIPVCSIDVENVGVAGMRGEFTMGVVDAMRGKRMLIPWTRDDLRKHVEGVQQLLDATSDDVENGESNGNIN